MRPCHAIQLQQQGFVGSAIQLLSYLFSADHSTRLVFSADWDLNICIPFFLFSKHCATSRTFFPPRKWRGCLMWKHTVVIHLEAFLRKYLCVYANTQAHESTGQHTVTHTLMQSHTHTENPLSTASWPFICIPVLRVLFLFACHLISMHDYILNSYFRLFHISGPYLIFILLCCSIFRLISLYLYVLCANINKLIT